MSRYYSYLNTSKEVIASYRADVPLSVWLKQFFATRKQMGSRDRREVSSIVYKYYRLGKAVDASVDERIVVSEFLGRDEPSELLNLLKPEWNEQIALPLGQKIALVKGFNQAAIFPFIDEIDGAMDKTTFALSHLIQPNLFIRIRPGLDRQVKRKLDNEGIAYVGINENCLELGNSTAINTILDMDKEVVIQDHSSQQVATFLKPLANKRKQLKVWDCCAASGGKSILAVDTLDDIDLTVSDVRQSIIHNLQKRFDKAGIKGYKSYVGDMTKPINELKGKQFDLIICDAPCSGSGTWGRTPENLVHFKKETIGQYSQLQKKIVSNAINHLAQGGYLLYITCSVFNAENEEVVSYIQDKFPHLHLESKALLSGYDKRADTMYAALLSVNSEYSKQLAVNSEQ